MRVKGILKNIVFASLLLTATTAFAQADYAEELACAGAFAQKRLIPAEGVTNSPRVLVANEAGTLVIYAFAKNHVFAAVTHARAKPDAREYRNFQLTLPKKHMGVETLYVSFINDAFGVSHLKAANYAISPTRVDLGAAQERFDEAPRHAIHWEIGATLESALSVNNTFLQATSSSDLLELGAIASFLDTTSKQISYCKRLKNDFIQDCLTKFEKLASKHRANIRRVLTAQRH